MLVLVRRVILLGLLAVVGVGVSAGGAASAPTCPDNASPVINGVIPYCGGPVQHNPTFYAVYWVPSGDSFEPAVVNGDQTYEDWMDQFLGDVSQTNLANIASTYYDNVSGSVGTGSTFAGKWVDTTNSYPEAGTAADPLQPSDIAQEVDRAFAKNSTWTTGANTTVVVFTAAYIQMCFGSQGATGNACTPAAAGTTLTGACAAHFYDNDGLIGTPYVAMPDEITLGVGGGGACTTPQAFGGGGIFADTEVTFLAHELFEAETDPDADDSGWANPSGGIYGSEIADECEGPPPQFGVEPFVGPTNSSVNGHLYLLPQLWADRTGACQGSLAEPGFVQVYGPFGVNVDQYTGNLVFGLTSLEPNTDNNGDYSVTINWGDGTPTQQGFAMYDPATADYLLMAGRPQTTRGHEYTAAGNYAATVTYVTGSSTYSTAIAVQAIAVPLTITPTNATWTYGETQFDGAADVTYSLNASPEVPYTPPPGTITGLTCMARSITVFQTGTVIDPTTAAPGTYSIQCMGATSSVFAITYHNPSLTQVAQGDLTIQQATSATTVASSANPSWQGDLVTLTATVSPEYTGTPSGTVTFYDNGANIGSVSLANGHASLSTTSLLLGAHTITASYGGDTNFLSSTSLPLTQYVDTDISHDLSNGVSNLYLRGAYLGHADLDGASLVSANLMDSNLTYASLRNAVLTNTNLNFADLSHADLSNTNLSHANLMDAKLVQADLAGATLNNANFSGADLAGATLSNAKLSNTNFMNANLVQADLAGATLINANFSGADLAGATLTGATLAGVSWNGAICPDGTNSSNDFGTCVNNEVLNNVACTLAQCYPTLQAAETADTDGEVITVIGTVTGTTNITHGVTVDGKGSGILAGGGHGPVVTVEPGVTVTLENLSIEGGNNTRTVPPGLITGTGYGGGIANDGNLTLDGVFVANNTASLRGGGIYNQGRLSVSGSTITGNTVSSGGGGGIFDFFGSGITVSNSSAIIRNSAAAGGGVVEDGGSFEMDTTSDIFSNTASGVGGGIELLSPQGSVILNSHAFISQNTAANAGGGIYIDQGTVTLNTNAVITKNTVTGAGGEGGGIYNSAGTINPGDGTGTISGNTPNDIYP